MVLLLEQKFLQTQVIGLAGFSAFRTATLTKQELVVLVLMVSVADVTNGYMFSNRWITSNARLR